MPLCGFFLGVKPLTRRIARPFLLRSYGGRWRLLTFFSEEIKGRNKFGFAVANTLLTERARCVLPLHQAQERSFLVVVAFHSSFLEEVMFFSLLMSGQTCSLPFVFLEELE